MSHLPLPAAFDTSASATLIPVTGQDDAVIGHIIPSPEGLKAAGLAPEALAQIARNLSLAFRGQTHALQYLGTGLEMYARHHPATTDIHFRRPSVPGEAGVSVRGASFCPSAGYEGRLAALIADYPERWAAFMNSCSTERRHAPRSEAGEGGAKMRRKPAARNRLSGPPVG